MLKETKFTHIKLCEAVHGVYNFMQNMKKWNIPQMYCEEGLYICRIGDSSPIIVKADSSVGAYEKAEEILGVQAEKS